MYDVSAVEFSPHALASARCITFRAAPLAGNEKIAVSLLFLEYICGLCGARGSSFLVGCVYTCHVSTYAWVSLDDIFFSQDSMTRRFSRLLPSRTMMISSYCLFCRQNSTTRLNFTSSHAT